MLVMGGAIAVHAVVYLVATKRTSPIFTESFSIPSRRDINARIDWWGVIVWLGMGVRRCLSRSRFGVPLWWGAEIYVFVAMMVVGMVVFQQLQQRL